ncbi:MAG TPA: DUF108 domain-containing protein [Albidovulum sp.]|nr:DUF108 domain-containing protein [Paracoccaceae bacterium]HPE26109.1 DUF108 domain-containing protein [Albidovulum sp.]HRV61909.1 DUF108 domain-containing protein [Albidovulum sp.]
MTDGARTVSVIGAGRIGRAVIDFVGRAPGLRLGRVLSRSGLPDTADADAFFTAPADLIIDTAGPGALRAFGPRALGCTDLWTVGAAALADDALRAGMEAAAVRAGHALTLFTPWFAGIGHGLPHEVRGLHIRAERPGIGAPWSGALADAVLQFPDDLNSAVAAALCGPGIAATTVEMSDSGPGGAHRIEARLVTGFATFRSVAEFTGDPGASHPTAAAIIGALRRAGSALRHA